MKQLCVISCPIDTHSGYGARSRDFVKALYEIKKDEWEFQILSQRWGSTPWGYIESEPDWKWLNPLVNKTGQLHKQPDVWIQITVPNEFQPIGKYNIGVTAGIETTLCDGSWVEGVNRMNLTLVSSNHAKQVFEQSQFERRDQQGRTVGHVKLEKPVHVLFEGVDLSKYFCIEDQETQSDSELVKALNQIPESFCYLFVGHWLQGDLGEDRKNVSLMLKTFLETYQNKKERPALILKTSGAGSSIMDREDLLAKIDAIRNSVGENLPNVYLLHGELSDSDMNALYNHKKVKAMYNLTKGEGFGRPILEFAMAKKPIIVSAWSGHMDFLIQDLTCLVGGELKKVHPSSVVPNMILSDSMWYSPNIQQAKYYLKDVYENYKKYKELAKQQSHRCKTNFNLDKMKELLSKYLEVSIPKQVQLQLPKLKKIELPKLNKV